MPHQNQAKCHIRIKPNATSESSQMPHWSGKLACFKEKHTITASGRTWMMSVIASIPNDVNEWFRPMANTRTSIFVCYCHRLWFNAPPHSVLIIRPFSASEPPIKYHWAAHGVSLGGRWSSWEPWACSLSTIYRLNDAFLESFRMFDGQ